MLSIHFESILCPGGLAAGPAAWMELVGPELFLGGQDKPTARHDHHQWRLKRDYFTAVCVTGRVRVCFENGQEYAYGPFAGLRIAGNVLLGSDGQTLAYYDETSAQWQLAAEDQSCPRVRVLPAE